MGCPLRATRISSKDEVFYFIKNDKKRRIFVFIMAIAIVALLAFGGSYAYFTATAKTSTGTAKTALVKLENNNAAIQVAQNNALPGETIFDTSLTIQDSSTRDTWVFAKLTVTFGGVAVNLSDVNKLVITPDADWDSYTGSEAGVYAIKNTAKTGDAVGQANDIVFDIKVALASNLTDNNMQGEADDAHEFMNKEVVVTIAFAAVQGNIECNTAYGSADFVWSNPAV